MKNQKITLAGRIPKMSVRLIRWVLVLGVFALIMQVFPPRAQAYDLSSLNGSYADSLSGFFPISHASPPIPPISAYGPVYEAGLWTFDGAGGVTATLVFNFGRGNIIGDNWDLNITGTYTVNTNGTGSMTFTGNHRRHFVIGDGGRQLRYVVTNLDGDVTGGSMVKQ